MDERKILCVSKEKKLPSNRRRNSLLLNLKDEKRFKKHNFAKYVQQKQKLTTKTLNTRFLLFI